MKPRYNIAPNQLVPLIRQSGEIEFIHWGFLPYWKKQTVGMTGFINARSESIEAKPTFKNAFRERRALVVADGYYEWKKIGRQKQPFYIRLKNNAIFAFAAIWENESCAILTTQSNSLLSSLHERMPLIIPPKDYEIWLDKKESIQQAIYPLLQSSPSYSWEFYPVTSKMGDPRFETIECIHSLQ